MNRTSHFSLALAALALAPAAQAQVLRSTSSTTPVNMAVPSVVTGATLVGPLPAGTAMTGSVSLAPSNRAAFRAYADAVSDPKNPLYHRFLGPAAIGTRFGAPVATVNAVAAYLKSKGLTVSLVCDTRLAILFKGKASAVESAFATKLNRYHVATRPTPGPTDFYSYTTPPKLPTTFAGKVVSIGGLQNAYFRAPLTTYLTPAQSRGLYGAAPLYTSGKKGLGVTVGITNLADGWRMSNLPIFYSTYNLPAPAGGVGSNVKKVSVAGVDGTTQAEGIESNLDIQMVLAEAPSATVIVYDGWTDGVSIAAREVNDNLIDIASESWVFYDSTDVLEAINDQHVAMTVEGITYMAGTGDWGADESRGNYPHAYPDVLAIGGTDATVSDANGTRAEEKGWYYSGAGWEPTAFSFNGRPSYQKGANLPASPQKRIFPDVSLHAAGSWMVANNSVIAVGGTSSSGPQFAGQLALVLETLKSEGAADSYDGHFRLGRIHDLVYGLNGDPSAFYDVTTGEAEFLLPDGTVPQSTTGWDFVTGWGAPIVSGLHDALLAAGSVEVADAATSANIYTVSGPNQTLGTKPDGGVAALPSADGVSYSIGSVHQNGVGQVAAAKIDVTLQTKKARRSATVKATISAANKTTATVFLLNRTTNTYDLMATMPGTGVMTPVSVPVSLDDQGGSPYVDASTGTLSVLVRAIKPTRLGSETFRLTVDQAMVTEKVARN